MLNKKSIALALMLAAPLAANAAGDAAAGKAKAAMCAGCHGMDGKAVLDGYPHLKGQNAKYIISSLKAFRDKTRTGGQSALMYPMAGLLSDADIENIAAYFSSLK
ncbi:MAG: c-type cytochrome [Psychrobium sp.]